MERLTKFNNIIINHFYCMLSPLLTSSNKHVTSSYYIITKSISRAKVNIPLMKPLYEKSESSSSLFFV